MRVIIFKDPPKRPFKTSISGRFSGYFFLAMFGPHPQYGWDFRKKFRKISGKTPETLSERFLEFPSRVQLGSPKPYNSRHLKAPERFQNSLPPSTAGDASFFRSGSGEGLSESVMKFPAVLGVFLNVFFCLASQKVKIGEGPPAELRCEVFP